MNQLQTTILLLLLLIAITVIPAYGEVICHKGNTIDINENAVQKHLDNHGDSRGACEITPSGNLVVNGSFEDTSVTLGTWIPLSDILGWTSSNGIEVRNNVAGTASDGNNFVELDVYSNSNMVQTLNTANKVIYRLTFDYSPRMEQSTSTNTIEVYWDGILLDTITGNGIGASDNVWTTHTYTITATSTSTILEFRAAGISDSYGGSLDNVKVVHVNEGVKKKNNCLDCIPPIFTGIKINNDKYIELEYQTPIKSFPMSKIVSLKLVVYEKRITHIDRIQVGTVPEVGDSINESKDLIEFQFGWDNEIDSVVVSKNIDTVYHTSKIVPCWHEGYSETCLELSVWYMYKVIPTNSINYVSGSVPTNIILAINTFDVSHNASNVYLVLE